MVATSTAAAPAPAASRAHDLLAGARAMGPWLLGIAPYGLVIGISAAQAGIPVLAGWLSGPLVFAGSAQVATIQLLDGGAAPLVVVVAALSVNLRLILYSATMAGHWTGTPRWWRAAAAYLIVDPSVAVGVDGYARTGDRRRGHLRYAGGAVTLWIAWVVAITVGATVGTGLPAGLRLEYVVPLFLIGDVVPRLTGTAVRRGVAVAALVAVAGRWIPLHLGALAAIAAGLAVALLTPEDDR